MAAPCTREKTREAQVTEYKHVAHWGEWSLTQSQHVGKETQGATAMCPGDALRGAAIAKKECQRAGNGSWTCEGLRVLVDPSTAQ